jgi:hypothetical protein
MNNNITFLISSGFFTGFIVALIIILIYQCRLPKIKENKYRKELSQNSVFWEPLDWK